MLISTGGFTWAWEKLTNFFEQTEGKVFGAKLRIRRDSAKNQGEKSFELPCLGDSELAHPGK
jgi:hypothetical protein